MHFWEADFSENIGLGLLLIFAPPGSQGKMGLGFEVVLFPSLREIGGADAGQDRCSVLHKGESHRAAVPGLHPSLYLGR